MPAPPPSDPHYAAIKSAVPRGELTVFYGAGINIAQQAMPRKFDSTVNFCPTGTELALYIAGNCLHPDLGIMQELQKKEAQAIAGGSNCNQCDFNKTANSALARLATPALARVSQYAQTMRRKLGYNLKQDLHSLFERSFPSTGMHDLLAELPGKVTRNRRPIFITTNYDTVLERALAAKGEPFDILFYRAPGSGTPVWLYHWKKAHLYYDPHNSQTPVDGYDEMIAEVSSYQDLPLGDGRTYATGALAEDLKARTIIVKIHGTVAPNGYERSSFVISENDYITFLRQVSVENPLPNPLIERLTNSHFLFLGYGLADWNILALCQQLWRKRTIADWENWAIQYCPSDYDVARWRAESSTAVSAVDVFDIDVEQYAAELKKRL